MKTKKLLKKLLLLVSLSLIILMTVFLVRNRNKLPKSFNVEIVKTGINVSIEDFHLIEEKEGKKQWELIVDYRIGGVILFERNFEDPDQLIRLISDLQSLAISCPASVPLFISVDQEGGRVARLKSPFSNFPQPSCLGQAQSESLAHRFGLALGQ